MPGCFSEAFAKFCTRLAWLSARANKKRLTAGLGDHGVRYAGVGAASGARLPSRYQSSARSWAARKTPKPTW